MNRVELFSDLRLPGRLIFWLGLSGVCAGMIGAQLATSPGWIRFFDNLHWTAGTLAAACIVTLGWLAQRRAEASPARGWFALGFGGYAVGQLTWDLQVWLGYEGFPAPSDLFYLWLGPALAIGLVAELRSPRWRAQRRPMLLDSLALAIACLTLVLVLYLPRRGALDPTSIAVLATYPSTLLIAAAVLLVMIPTLRLRSTPGLLLFLGGITITATSWMVWNLMALEGTAVDGAWFNASFSVAILGAAVGAAGWNPEYSDDPRWRLLCEGFLRLLPLAVVILSSTAVITMSYRQGVPEIARQLTLLGALTVIALAALRQGEMVRDRDRLAAAQEAIARSEHALRQERGFLRSLFGALPDPVWIKDTEGVYLACNSAFERLFGATEAEIVGHTDFDFVDHELASFFRHHDRRALDAGRPRINEEWLTFAADGQRGLFETIKTPVRDSAGRLLGVLGIARDITQRTESEQRVRTASADLEATLRAIPDLLFEFDQGGHYLNLWAQDEGLLAAERERVLDHRVDDVLPPEAANAVLSALKEASRYGYSRGQQILLDLPSGPHWFELSTARKRQPDQPDTFMMLSRDITPLKEQEEQLRRIALFDPLTDTPNRRLLVDRMRQAIAQARREDQLLAVCYLDLDGFKPVNDTLGHEAGDQMLVRIADRIGRTIRSGDTVARLGGDEFAVLLVGLDRAEDCSLTLDRILEAINQPVVIGGHSFTLGASIGVTLFPSDDEEADLLLRHADQAMYAAKQGGKNRYRFYDPLHDRRTRARRESAARIEQGLRNGEFTLYLQPKVELLGLKVVGAEMLLRWNHPQEGLLTPSHFLPVIEGHRLEIELDRWVIDTTLALLEDWQREGVQIELSVNVSARHLQNPDFLSNLRHATQRHPELPPGSLQIEIQESAALEHVVQVVALIRNCREFGVGFALDDFGTGYSSLAYLRRLPVETVKIGRGFVLDMLEESGDRAIVEGVIALARSFNLQTVAVGADTPTHIRMLRGEGCDLAQGFGIAPPMPTDEFLRWYHEWRPEGLARELE